MLLTIQLLFIALIYLAILFYIYANRKERITSIEEYINAFHKYINTTIVLYSLYGIEVFLLFACFISFNVFLNINAVIFELGLFVLILFLIKVIRPPVPKYPTIKKCFDVSGKRNPEVEDYIDMYLNEGNIAEVRAVQDEIHRWEECCDYIIMSSKLLKLRIRQRDEMRDEKPYHFILTRVRNGVNVPVDEFSCDIEWIEDRQKKLEEIDFAGTLFEYHMKDQRRLMTRALREEIMERDHYTCQICGKYMPDEVGLQIDHIVPVSKGGKTVPWNLQVLCSKCNSRKSNKTSINN